MTEIWPRCDRDMTEMTWRWPRHTLPPACRASRIPHSPEPPGDPPVHGSPRQRSSDHNHLRCTEDRRHCNARWRERGQAAPESADESESRERVRSGRVHESSFAYHRRLLSERFKSHFSPMTESMHWRYADDAPSTRPTATRFLPVSRPRAVCRTSLLQQVRLALGYITGVSRLDVSHHLNASPGCNLVYGNGFVARPPGWCAYRPACCNTACPRRQPF
jgi:hypothetical protein